MQASPEDARLAAKAFEYIASDAETLNRPIQTRILWARTVPNMIQRVERKILDQMAAADVPTFDTHLHERSAYRAMFLEGVSLADLDQQQFNGVPKALENADRLAAEIASHFLPGREVKRAA
jgi:chromosome partitioning protein